jgi:mannose-6-phosphate isomerase-like protein (cupin superfamily)
VVFGKVNPGGKLPVSFPRRLGQVPIYYNHEPTGRPCNPEVKWNSRYRDIPSCSPLFVFGHGLSYTTFEVSDLRLSSSTVSKNRSLQASVTVTNTGSRKGDEVVQLYLHDPVASISQPVRRLRGFERVTLAPGQSRTVTFTLDKSDFGFYDDRGRLVVEPGRIDVYAGSSVPGEFRPLTAALGCEQVAVTLIRIPPHSDFEQGTGHFHDEQEEVYIVTRGTLTMRFGDDIRPVTAGSVVRVAPRTPRSHRNEGDEPVELWAVSSRRDQGDATKIDDFWEASPDAAQAR